MANINQAVKKYMLDVEALKISAQTAAQVIASSLESYNNKSKITWFCYLRKLVTDIRWQLGFGAGCLFMLIVELLRG